MILTDVEYGCLAADYFKYSDPKYLPNYLLCKARDGILAKLTGLSAKGKPQEE